MPIITEADRRAAQLVWDARNAFNDAINAAHELGLRVNFGIRSNDGKRSVFGLTVGKQGNDFSSAFIFEEPL